MLYLLTVLRRYRPYGTAYAMAEGRARHGKGRVCHAKAEAKAWARWPMLCDCSRVREQTRNRHMFIYTYIYEYIYIYVCVNVEDI